MKRIATLIISILCFAAATSCSMSEVVDNAAVNENNTNQQDGIRLSFADTKDVSVYSTALESENIINRGIILVWHAGTPATSEPDYADLFDNTGIIGNGTPTPILPQLKNGFKLQTGDRVYIMANAIVSTLPTGLNENNINEKCSAVVLPGQIPGPNSSAALSGKINSWSPSNNTCVMTRSMAKVTVRLGETVTDVTGNFTADNVLYRIGNVTQFLNIMPVSPPLIGKRHPLNIGISWIKTPETKINNHTYYLGEFPNSDSTIVPGEYVDPAVFSRNRTFVLIEKINPTDTSFYRLDFYDNTTKKFMDIERNHHYVFTINKVRSEGYKDATNAWVNPSSNIEYTVTVDDGAAMTSNGQYAIVTSVDTAIVYGNQTNYTIATARYVLPAEMSSLTLASGTVDNNIAVTSGTNITLNAPTTLTATNQEVKITSTAVGTSVITFRIGNINHRLVVIVQAV